MTSIKENTDIIHPLSYPGRNTFGAHCVCLSMLLSLLNGLACLSEAKKNDVEKVAKVAVKSEFHCPDCGKSSFMQAGCVST